MIIINIRHAIRHLNRQKTTSALHIVGLTLGMSVCVLIALLLRYELSFDRYHHKADRIYRITSQYRDASHEVHGSSTPVPLAESLRAGITGVENVTLAHPFPTAQIEISPEKQFIQKNILVVNSEILDIFDIEVIAGNGHDALVKPYHALLTETTAKKFFGNENPLGKTFQFNREFNITVGGVVKDQPSNTSLPFSILLSFVHSTRFLGLDPNAWSMTQGNATFVLLPERPDIKHFEAQLKSIADKNINADPNLPRGIRGDLHLQTLKNIHFEPKYGGGPWIQAVNTTSLWFFAVIGFLVLALACINFINLSTAQAVRRAKEVGIRKSVGARRDQLIGQFLIESCLLAFVAGVLSIVIAQISLPSMNTLLDKGIGFNPLDSIELIAILLLTILVTGALAGLYPAWIIARFNPAVNLKPGSRTTQDTSPSILRKGLVVIQFTFSIGLLIAVGLIGQQLSFLRGKDLGFNKENIINIPIGDVSKAEVLAAGLSQIPQIKHFSFSTGSPVNGSNWGGMASLTDGNDPDRVLITLILADNQFSRLYDLKLLAGRFPLASDTNHVSRSVAKENRITKVLANEKSIKELGLELPTDAIGKHFWLSTVGKHAEIIGVVADFNASSLHKPVHGVMIMQRPQFYKQVGISIEANGDIPLTIAAIEKAWKNAYPDGVFEFNFLDQAIDNFYKAEMKLHTLFKFFAALAMCISCLGLWGLATFAAQNRIKEIGIRKVLGASVNAIVLLLSKDFLSMVVIGLAVAAPLVYYSMKNWLQNFAYQIEIGWEIFAIAGVASIAIALITVTIQTLKAALANPVDSLRSE